MQKTITSIILLCWAFATNAQFNDSTHYRLMLNSAGSVNSTNLNKAYLLNNTLVAGAKTKRLTLNATNTWMYGQQNSTLTNNDFSSIIFGNWYTSVPRLYVWGLLNYNTSFSLKINNQVLAGAGLAYSLVDTSTTYFNISDGLLYDKSKLLSNLNYDTWRNSFRIQYRFVIKKVVVLDGSNFLQSSLSDHNDYIIRSTNSLSFRLMKWLNLGTSLNYNRMNVTKSENLNFTFGFTVDKYF